MLMATFIMSWFDFWFNFWPSKNPLYRASHWCVVNLFTSSHEGSTFRSWPGLDLCHEEWGSEDVAFIELSFEVAWRGRVSEGGDGFEGYVQWPLSIIVFVSWDIEPYSDASSTTVSTLIEPYPCRKTELGPRICLRKKGTILRFI
jgi:hypothetical protein